MSVPAQELSTLSAVTEYTEPPTSASSVKQAEPDDTVAEPAVVNNSSDAPSPVPDTNDKAAKGKKRLSLKSFKRLSASSKPVSSPASNEANNSEITAAESDPSDNIIPKATKGKGLKKRLSFSKTKKSNNVLVDDAIPAVETVEEKGESKFLNKPTNDTIATSEGAGILEASSPEPAEPTKVDEGLPSTEDGFVNKLKKMAFSKPSSEAKGEKEEESTVTSESTPQKTEPIVDITSAISKPLEGESQDVTKKPSLVSKLKKKISFSKEKPIAPSSAPLEGLSGVTEKGESRIISSITSTETVEPLVVEDLHTESEAVDATVEEKPKIGILGRLMRGPKAALPDNTTDVGGSTLEGAQVEGTADDEPVKSGQRSPIPPPFPESDLASAPSPAEIAERIRAEIDAVPGLPGQTEGLQEVAEAEEIIVQAIETDPETGRPIPPPSAVPRQVHDKELLSLLQCIPYMNGITANAGKKPKKPKKGQETPGVLNNLQNLDQLEWATLESTDPTDGDEETAPEDGEEDGETDFYANVVGGGVMLYAPLVPQEGDQVELAQVKTVDSLAATTEAKKGHRAQGKSINNFWGLAPWGDKKKEKKFQEIAAEDIRDTVPENEGNGDDIVVAPPSGAAAGILVNPDAIKPLRKLTKAKKSVETKWIPSTDKLSFEALWWGFKLYLPPPVMAILNEEQLNAVKFASIITTALTWFFSHIPISSMPLALQPALLVLKTIAPYLSYIGTFITWSWGEIQSFDKGHGVILSATWILPVNLHLRSLPPNPAPTEPPAQPTPTEPPAQPTPEVPTAPPSDPPESTPVEIVPTPVEPGQLDKGAGTGTPVTEASASPSPKKKKAWIW
ncbi:hypothetical protein DL96DRAFT_1811336 [Flagelloscypha sp. PMI_526]|nr:hypothetical protein DL96DRAFT_1811336 [Flagelloscypha sp. PMI_526]